MWAKYKLGDREIDIEPILKGMASKLGYSEEKYFIDIFDKSDFLFIIELSAILEVSINDYLSYRINVRGIDVGSDNVGKFQNYFQKLPMQGRTGKLPLARSLGLISKNNEKHASLLLKIRNSYVHNIINMRKDIHDLYSVKEIREFLSGVTAGNISLKFDEPMQYAFALKYFIFMWITYLIAEMKIREKPIGLIDIIKELDDPTAPPSIAPPLS